jgi:hypothetical protein
MMHRLGKYLVAQPAASSTDAAAAGSAAAEGTDDTDSNEAEVRSLLQYPEENAGNTD